MKKLIDYYNEKYTKKKEYICKDLKPVRLLENDEYEDFTEKNGAIGLGVYCYPLFKIPNIKNKRPDRINVTIKYGDMINTISLLHIEDNVYSESEVDLLIKDDKVVINIPVIDLYYSLTLYIDSPELPKLEYPKNKMDMYRAYDFIDTVADSVDDDYLYTLIEHTQLSYPNNIDEIDLYFNDKLLCSYFDLRKNAYFINTEKDNYYTILDAIRRGQTIYRDLNSPLVNWTINKEEKIIDFKYGAKFNEIGFISPQ